MSQDARRGEDLGGQAVLLAAGLADVGLRACGTALGAARGLLGRSDLGELAARGRQDLQARGRLALDSLGGGGEAHMEVLARHAYSQVGRGSGA